MTENQIRVINGTEIEFSFRSVRILIPAPRGFRFGYMARDDYSPSKAVPAKPAIWNPNAAVNWSLLNTPAFGAYLHAKNAVALGRFDEARVNMKWFYGILIYELFLVCLIAPLDSPHSLLNFSGFAILLMWYLTVARRQAKYVKDAYGNGYLRKPWLKVTLIGFAFRILALVWIFFGACGAALLGSHFHLNKAAHTSLKEEKKAFTTNLIKHVHSGEPVDVPPPNQLETVMYRTALGNFSAYVSPMKNDGAKHPAIIWIVGGFGNGISDIFWTMTSKDNNQAANVFREKGIITMYPSLRGGNQNPGEFENFYGEVDDVLSALDFLSSRPDVDPSRIYLGGHSTGGTLALLVAESTNRFRAIFSLGPVSDPRVYGDDVLVYDTHNEKESSLRTPINWLRDISRPTFVFSGTVDDNLDELEKMRAASTNSLIHFELVPGKTHHSSIAPVTALLANKILMDKGAASSIEIQENELRSQLDAR